jgi:hypothetical protein
MILVKLFLFLKKLFIFSSPYLLSSLGKFEVGGHKINLTLSSLSYLKRSKVNKLHI